MPKKTPGSINPPPDQAQFDELPLRQLCRTVEGRFYRLSSLNPKTGQPWPAIHFSSRGHTRFDPRDGTGTLYLGETLTGIIMETFDDQWGPVGSIGRSLTARQLTEWWVTLVSLPTVQLFDATGQNLSKVGADAQLVTGAYEQSRPWALRMMRHPAQIDGILYVSRHDVQKRNVALFRRERFKSVILDLYRRVGASISRWRGHHLRPARRLSSLSRI